MTEIFNINALTRENIKKLEAYSSARNEFKGLVDNVIFLDANENPFENGINRYPDPLQNQVKQILTEIHKISQEQMLLGNGSDEVLDLIFRAFCEPNIDNIITLPPTYGMYQVLAEVNAIEVKEVLLNKNFQPDVDTILSAVNANTKLLFLCSPNNPTGNSFSEEAVLTLLDKFKGLIVIDEAYIDFSKQQSWLKRLEEFPNLIITQTLSKAYGMAGIRLGICYASKEIISILNRIKPPYNVNQLTQQKAISRLSDLKQIRHQIADILVERERLSDALKDISCVKTIYPSDANFILIKVDDATKRYNQLLEQNIVIRNRSKQHLCENCLRLTIGTPIENKKLIEAFKSL
ncbi:histidinol-phosphate transaminase [Aurantibacter aestuarii]|uniref:Histidinol-phosphate aminotransferase n=1 Tax=Aurantibacter aestuarii TaxID=1266046 RepID=A0A2T1N8S3_9FLAO|nr:histidinol-phosphate transaminase [Aurantibacter aestuarii]PSG88232.1 histidinol-phosphate transaminase [Aurantibacter aestuarii]